MSLNRPPLAVTFFGATGGCTLAALTRTLQAGILSVALARSQSKLHNLLSSHDISPDTITNYLTIIEGNVTDAAAVRKALTHPSRPDRLTRAIISGIGGAPQLAKGWYMKPWAPFRLDQPTICTDATATILAALRGLHDEGVRGKPLFAVMSTTGITSGQRDVPLAMVPLYRWGLAVPHEDKRRIEDLLKNAPGWEAGDEALIWGFVSVRASLLTEGAGKGLKAVRMGYQYHPNRDREMNSDGPAVGYTITRDSVGLWIFEELVKSEVPSKWTNRYVTLTN